MARTILIVDDEKSIRDSLAGALEDEGFTIKTLSAGTEVLKFLQSQSVDLILLDIWMPELDGIATLKLIKESYADQAVIMMSGHGTIETAVKSTKLGAYDFIEKPLSLEKLLVLIQNVFETQDLYRENKALRQQLEKHKQLIGQSPSMKKIKEMIKQVAPTTGSVLITGENGTGKDLAAHSIHSLSNRFSKPYIEVNCAAIPEELIESELFGHEKGAFTGATQQKRGKFDLADGGTLFLDEIGDMSLKTQAKILRILQEQRFERVGGSSTINVDVRIVAATNKNLKEEINKGNFREDLYYRLNVIPFHIPPLRDRKEDLSSLTETFLEEFQRIHGRKPRALTAEASDVLLDYHWPGNVRELKNLIERIIILTTDKDDGKPITAATILENLQLTPGTTTGSGLPTIENTITNLRDARAEFEKKFIAKVLRGNNGNISRTASALGIERSHLHKKMKSYGIEGA